MFVSGITGVAFLIEIFGRVELRVGQDGASGFGDVILLPAEV